MPAPIRYLLPALKVFGWVLRRTRTRGRHLVATALNRLAPSLEYKYRDAWGYVHTAWLGDEMQALGFVGKPQLPDELRQIIRPGDWVIDVGANVGITTAQLCRLVGDRGTVWAIEPFPPNLARLRELKEVNRVQGLNIIAGALSDHQERTRLGLPADRNSGRGSLVDGGKAPQSVEVTAWPLDKLTQTEPTGRLSLVKIDVEGHEPRVLEGARETLRRHRPAVLCEFNTIALGKAESSPSKLLEWFGELGYRPTAGYKEGRLLRRLETANEVDDIVISGSGVIDLLLVADEGLLSQDDHETQAASGR